MSKDSYVVNSEIKEKIEKKGTVLRIILSILCMCLISPFIAVMCINDLLARSIDTLVVKTVFFCRKSKQPPNPYLELKISVIANAISTSLINTFTIWGIAFGILKHKGTFSNISSAKLGGLCFLVAFAASSLISGIAASIVWHKHKDKALYYNKESQQENATSFLNILYDISDQMSYIIISTLPFYLLFKVYRCIFTSIKGCCTNSIENHPSYETEEEINSSPAHTQPADILPADTKISKPEYEVGSVGNAIYPHFTVESNGSGDTYINI